MALSKDERIKKIEELKKFWTNLFTIKDLGVEVEQDVYFYPKPLFKNENCFKLFESELKGLFFTEIVDFNFNPVIPRKLYRVEFNPSSISKYKKVSTPIGDQYEVNINEFSEVVAEVEGEIVVKTPLDDSHIKDLTARDLICVFLKVPESNTKWINDLIKKSK